MFKKILFRLLSILLYLYCKSWRLKVVNREEFEKGQFVAALWHEHLLPLSFSYYGKGVATLASKSKDGDLIAQELERWGFVVARGSSTRGGARGYQELLKLGEAGRNIAITVDGPKGPRRKVKAGVIHIAKSLNLPLIPVTLAASPVKIFASWDRFVLPLPFAKVEVVAGDRVFLSEKTDEKTLREESLLLEEKILAHEEQTIRNRSAT